MRLLACGKVGQQWVYASDVSLSNSYSLHPEPTLASSLLRSHAATVGLFLVQHVDDLLSTRAHAEALGEKTK